MDLNRWKLFRGLDQSLISKCKLAKFIFEQKVGFIVLENDDVYFVIDASSEGYRNLDQRSHGNLSMASKVESLCGQEVMDFSGNELGFTALTKDGCLWLYENDDSVDRTRNLMFRSALLPDGDKCEIKQISQGRDHSLCLNSNGQVFSWGQNGWGQLGTGASGLVVKDPQQISSISGNSFVQVAAGSFTSNALDSSGNVWTWGSNDRLSFYNMAVPNEATPKRFENLCEIRKIAAGWSHVLALSQTGELFFWGYFSDKSPTVFLPKLMNKDSMKPVTDIGSTSCSSLAAFQTTEKVYIWVDEAFACAKYPLMLKTIISVKPKHRRVQEAWMGAFNDASTSDIIFSVDGERLYAHAAFLKLQCEHFRNMLGNDWAESTGVNSPIEMKEFSFRIFHAFLYFLYNESLPDPDMPLEDLAELLRAADYYGDEDLRMAAKNKFKRLLNPENACFVYASAVKSNDQNLQEYTVRFIAPVYKQVVKSGGFVGMDSELKTQLMVDFADLDVFQVSKKLSLQ